jgi:hypothetical protein
VISARNRLLEQHENRATFAYIQCTMSAKLEPANG